MRVGLFLKYDREIGKWSENVRFLIYGGELTGMLLSRALCLNCTETNTDTIKYQNICEIPKHSICEIALIEIKIFFEPLRLYEGFRTAIKIAEIDISVYKEVFEANYFQTGVFWSRSDKKNGALE